MTATSLQTRVRPWWLTLIYGICAIIAGILLFTAPAKTTVALVQILGIYWLVAGIFELVGMFVDHTAWGWKLFIGIVSIIAGIYILRYPLVSAVAVPKIAILVLGLWGIIYGVVLLIMAFRGGGWGAGIVGALGILFGIILVLNWTALGAAAAMVWAAAIFGVIGGIVLVIRAFQTRNI